jgi:hypothetical protein
MNREQYNSDTRYEKVLHNMDLLGIMDVTTTRQHKNGTIVWRLPIKNSWNNGKLIEVASFKTGYVRNQNSGYSNYQLNKRYFEDEYFKDYDWIDGKQKWNGKYRKFNTKRCILIPIEIDRLEYLISYCLKNYFIKRANEVADGKLIPKWRVKTDHSNCEMNLEYKNERINDLKEKLDAMTEDRDYKVQNFVYKVQVLENKLSNAISPTKHECTKQHSVKLEEKLYDLQNKLATIKRISE